MAEAIGTLGNVDTLDIHGLKVVHPEPDKSILILATQCDASQDGTFRQPNGTAGYQPASSTKFVCLALVMSPINNNNATAILSTSSNDAGISAAGGATPVTSFIGAVADSAQYFITPAGTGVNYAFNVSGFELTNTSADYLSMENQAAVAFWAYLYGYETAE